MHDTIITIFPDEEFAADRERELQRIHEETVEVHGLFSVIHKHVFEQNPLLSYIDDNVARITQNTQNAHDELRSATTTRQRRNSCKWVTVASIGISVGGLIMIRWISP